MNDRNLTLLTDFYELTMGNGYLENGLADTVCCFDLYFRKVPDNGGFAVMCGLEQAINYIKKLSFTDEDIAYLRDKKIFSEKFLDYLRNFKFSCDVWAIPEGTPVFPNEPLVIVKGPAIQAQLMETMLLLCINHQCLIATKAARIVKAADGRAVMEFGSRRAQGSDGAIYGARAAYIGGCAGTACTISDKEMGTPALGTMAHSWVQMFDSELDAFRAYAKCYPDACLLLVDTYNVLKSGIPNAIKVFNELRAEGHEPAGIRIDSGDITYLSRKARKMLDDAGFPNAKICISNSLDEYIIEDILRQGACIDSFGVGERLITSRSEPVFGGVYKLTAVEKDGQIIPKIKLSENVTKITTPDFKELWRFYDKTTGKAIADLITCYGEEVDDTKPYTIFDPEHPYKKKTVTDFTAKKLLVQIFDKGECVYESPSATEIRDFCREQIGTLWSEVTRFENPHEYYVDLSKKLWDKKNDLLNEMSV
ncbi:nicotinate phosphoribosyltransferase [Huintestinicola butyrica]|jgi:putative nicotinate phosphoribosyltransferase|uniref:nicotinate phosphoribosyltransferase n=1 Tax=Huintestinicola butyrica TaxID=2981728 RepID=UPI000821F1C6|nr:nicotinate phosphoribosyltransferase [Huintestinicola butyrica]MBS6592221.1 nicotinate phosphoribosyltransferase [Ruminococcus sp.]MCU6728407.1 nicotinate phosphoribosyltransferase [Huintestinicola butyrica]SCJ13649.1 Nicotinate phosphoribosyltransferase 2 [uncultured Ruminococcus sp.]